MKRQLVQTVLKQTSILMLSTISAEGVWTSPAYFTSDAQNNIYFLSETHSQHMKDIWINSLASVEVSSSDSLLPTIQIIGTVSLAVENKKNKTFQDMLFMLHKGQDVMKSNDIKMIKLTPKRVIIKLHNKSDLVHNKIYKIRPSSS